MWGSEMVAYVKNYEAMYRALVRRLVDIADSANTMGADSHGRILDWDGGPPMWWSPFMEALEEDDVS